MNGPLVGGQNIPVTDLVLEVMEFETGPFLAEETEPKMRKGVASNFLTRLPIGKLKCFHVFRKRTFFVNIKGNDSNWRTNQSMHSLNYFSLKGFGSIKKVHHTISNWVQKKDRAILKSVACFYSQIILLPFDLNDSKWSERTPNQSLCV